jgi:hypothetical protein
MQFKYMLTIQPLQYLTVILLLNLELARFIICALELVLLKMT